MDITVKRLTEIEAEFGKSITLFTPWGNDTVLKMKFDRYKQVDLKRLNEMLPYDLRAVEQDIDDEGSYAYELMKVKLTK